MSTVKRVIVFDPGLLHRHGHFYVHTKAIKDYFTANSVEVLIATNSLIGNIAEEFNAHQILNFSGWDNQRYQGLTYAAHWTYANLRSNDSLKRFNQLDIRADDLVIMHSASPNELVSIANWYKTLQVKPFLAACVHVSPYYYADEEDHAIAASILTRSLGIWRDIIHLGKVVLAATNDELASHFSEIGDFRTQTLPPIIEIEGARKYDSAPNDRPVNVFFSGYHVEKGIALLVDTLSANHFEGLSFTLQVGNESAANEVERILKDNSQVEILKGSSEPDVYEKIIGSADAVLLPYNPNLYHCRTSGIFMEALALGKPVVVTANTVMSREMIDLGLPGIIIKDFDTTSLREALRGLHHQFDVRKKIATSISKPYAESIKTASYMNKILDYLSISSYT